MTRGEAVNWLINITADIGKAENRDLWHYEQALSEIRELLESEPERKTGKWIPDNNNYYEERYICSACKRSYKVDMCMGKPMWSYCPCGAKMEEGEQDANANT